MAGLGHQVVAVAVANQRETVGVLDAEMRSVRPAMLWCDERGRAQVARVAAELGARRVHERTGKPVELCPALYRLLWLRDEEPASFARARHFVDVQGYLNWRLTGRLVTSWASADPFGLLDMRRFSWDEELMGQLALAPALFSPLVAPGTPVGRVTPEAAAACGLPAGVLVVAGGGDGQAAGLGARALSAGRAYCNLGTAAVAGVGIQQYRADLAFRTMTSCVPGDYVCEALLRSRHIAGILVCAAVQRAEPVGGRPERRGCPGSRGRARARRLRWVDRVAPLERGGHTALGWRCAGGRGGLDAYTWPRPFLSRGAGRGSHGVAPGPGWHRRR